MSGQISDSIDFGELVRLVGDDTKLRSSERDPLREMVWRQASADLVFFLTNFWSIDVIGKGYANVPLRKYQISEARVFEASTYRDRVREIRLKARQIGFTTIDASGAFWNAFFRSSHPWLISSKTEDDAKATTKWRIKRPYDLLPRWVKERGPTIVTDNQELIEFDNSSWIESIPASGGAGRSKAVFGVLVDEYAFVENGDDLMAALDPLCYGPMYVFSTANGRGNPFERKWNEAQRSDSEWNQLSRKMRPDEPWNGTFVPWHVVPGRDEKWHERERRKHRDQLWIFYQENPSTPEEAFAKSGRNAFNVDLLRQSHICEPYWRFDLMKTDFTDYTLQTDALVGGEEQADLELWVWEKPTVERHEDGSLRRKPNYVISCDPAEGLDHGDRTSIWVVNANTWEVAATFRGHYDVEELDHVLNWLGHTYFTALIGVERNNHGLVPLKGLRDMWYSRLYRMDTFAQIKLGDRTPRYGWYTSKGTKPMMVREFRGLTKDEVMVLHDARLIEEAQWFVEDGKGSYAASPGQHDDHIMGALIAAQLVKDVGDYPILWQDPKKGPITMGELMNLGADEAPDDELAEGIGQGERTSYSRPSFFV